MDPSEQRYSHSDNPELELQVHPMDKKVLDVLSDLPEIQTKVKIMLVQQNSPGWAFGFLLGCVLTSQKMLPEHRHTKILQKAYDYLCDRGIRESTARPEYEKYAKVWPT